jgi:hypothetical protein
MQVLCRPVTIPILCLYFLTFLSVVFFVLFLHHPPLQQQRQKPVFNPLLLMLNVVVNLTPFTQTFHLHQLLFYIKKKIFLNSYNIIIL